MHRRYMTFSLYATEEAKYNLGDRKLAKVNNCWRYAIQFNENNSTVSKYLKNMYLDLKRNHCYRISRTLTNDKSAFQETNFLLQTSHSAS